jgi:inosine-uridine nucleoside N-ribohydrolase
LLLILGLYAFLSGTAAAERNVWIDADPACGLGKTRDVDDCWAIIAAIRSSRLNVVALSTVFGNVNLDKATAVARSLLTSIGTHEPIRTVPPVYAGATKPIGRDPVVPLAVRELESALTERPMTILALGPPTNIAMLLKKRPDLAHRIEAIVAVAGQRPGQVFKVGSTPILHFHDLNVRKDPDAFDIVLRSGVSVHLVPFEVGRQATVTRADLESLKSSGNLDRWIGRRSAAWLDFWEGTLGAAGFFPFDTMAVAYLVEPQLFSCGPMPTKIVRRRGLFVVRDTLEVAPSITDGNVVTYCWGLSKVMRNSVADFVSNPDRVSRLSEKPILYSVAKNRTE